MRNAFFVRILAVLTLCGCSTRDAGEADSSLNAIESNEQSLSAIGQEKIIPLRFVNLVHCDPDFVSCGVWKGRYHHVLRSIDVANQVFKAVGVQFYLKSFEAHQMPSFSDLRSSFDQPGVPAVPVAFSSVCAQLQKVFPALSCSEWTAIEEKKPDI
jgi:hypothetical protein